MYPLSSVQVRPASQTKMGTFSLTEIGGKKILKLASKPPKAADYTSGELTLTSQERIGTLNLYLVSSPPNALLDEILTKDMAKSHSTAN